MRRRFEQKKVLQKEDQQKKKEKDVKDERFKIPFIPEQKFRSFYEISYQIY